MRIRFFGTMLALFVGVSFAQADFTYLAIGDSSAFGETNRTQNPSNGDRGYVAPLADYLGSRFGQRPQVFNFAINGETTKSYFSGLVSDRASTDGITLNTRYQSYAPAYTISQQQVVSNFISAQAGGTAPIKFVTVQIGANDLSNTAETPGFLSLPPAQQQQLVGQTIQTAAGNLVQILTEIRTQLPNADIYVMGYHNPYGGSPSHPFYSLAAPAVRGLNGAAEQVSMAFGAKFVNFYPVVEGREQELTLINTFPADLINYVHLNNAGYTEVSRTLIDAASTSNQFPPSGPGGANPVPAPPALILLAISGLTLAGGRACRRSRR
ncbi:MAG: SGNH/GDSL hydrolase family protein [Fimbriiglobus sp.]